MAHPHSVLGDWVYRIPGVRCIRSGACEKWGEALLGAGAQGRNGEGGGELLTAVRPLTGNPRRRGDEPSCGPEWQTKVTAEGETRKRRRRQAPPGRLTQGEPSPLLGRSAGHCPYALRGTPFPHGPYRRPPVTDGRRPVTGVQHASRADGGLRACRASEPGRSADGHSARATTSAESITICSRGTSCAPVGTCPILSTTSCPCTTSPKTA